MAPPISASEVAALADKWNAKRDANFVNILKELPANVGDKLEKSRNSIPTVLYRAFNSNSTGDIPILNTTNGIIPPPYAHEHLPDKKLGFTMDTFGKLKDRTIDHLTTEKVEDGTEWSSWTASLLLALRYAYYKHVKKGGEAYIAIIKTKVLSSGQQRIYHVPALCSAFEGEDVANYAHEYLVLGVVVGAGFHAVGMQRLIDNRLLSIDALGSFLLLYFEKNDAYAFKARERMFARTERRRACHLLPGSQSKTLALACTREATGVDDDNLLFMLTVAFLGLRRRFWDNTESPEFEKDQIQILSDLQAAPNSCFALDFLKEDASVMSDIVWVDGYPEIEQTIRMLRALASIE
ncbi:hypothetical protein EG327_003529 [Venturia inaequalis]|uniref:DUF7587 domain-containing protein n=1 Tax=Venturia inaequalis TaxID=5025 RepID=A0A8H3VNU3_VENIN|nr:hypothetical protein EG327_003529 [Venturia inaequalis]